MSLELQHEHSLGANENVFTSLIVPSCLEAAPLEMLLQQCSFVLSFEGYPYHHRDGLIMLLF